jgi:hypothetical protein
MKQFAVLTAAAAVALLSGCAATIRSDVTAFNDWSSFDQSDKSYVFVTPPPALDTLEYHSYQALVSNELDQLGMHQAADPSQAKLLVNMRYMTVDHPTRVLMADPVGWGGPGFGRYGGWGLGSRYGYGFGGYGGLGRGYYSPFSYGPVEYEEYLRHNYERQLRVTIDSKSGKKLYDVTVVSASRVQATPRVMPAMVHSAFAGFPGASGVPRRIETQVDQTIPVEQLPAQVAAPAPAAIK